MINYPISDLFQPKNRKFVDSVLNRLGIIDAEDGQLSNVAGMPLTDILLAGEPDLVFLGDYSPYHIKGRVLLFRLHNKYGIISFGTTNLGIWFAWDRLPVEKKFEYVMNGWMNRIMCDNVGQFDDIVFNFAETSFGLIDTKAFDIMWHMILNCADKELIKFRFLAALDENSWMNSYIKNFPHSELDATLFKFPHPHLIGVDV